MTEDRLDVKNEIVRRAFVTSNYGILYNYSPDNAMSILIPEEKRNGEGELQHKNPMPKSP